MLQGDLDRCPYIRAIGLLQAGVKRNGDCRHVYGRANRGHRIPEERLMNDEQASSEQLRSGRVRRRIVLVVPVVAVLVGVLAWMYPPAGTTIEVRDSQPDTYQPPGTAGARFWVDCTHQPRAVEDPGRGYYVMTANEAPPVIPGAPRHGHLRTVRRPWGTSVVFIDDSGRETPMVEVRYLSWMIDCA